MLSYLCLSFSVFGRLNTIYSFIVIISLTNDKTVQETQKQYAYLRVSYWQNDNYIHIYDGKMANCREN